MRNWQSDPWVGGRLARQRLLPERRGAASRRRISGGAGAALREPHAALRRDQPTLGRKVTKVTYRFDPIENDTHVTVRQEDFGSPAAAQEHAVGWERTLNLLHGYLAGADGLGAAGPEATAA